MELKQAIQILKKPNCTGRSKRQRGTNDYKIMSNYGSRNKNNNKTKTP